MALPSKDEAKARCDAFLVACQRAAEEHGIVHYVSVSAIEARDAGDDGYQISMTYAGNLGVISQMADRAHTKILRKLADSDCLGAFRIAMTEGEGPSLKP